MQFVRRAVNSPNVRVTLPALSHGSQSFSSGSKATNASSTNSYKVIASLVAITTASTTASADVASPHYANYYSSPSPIPVPTNPQSLAISSSSLSNSKSTSPWDALLKSVAEGDVQALHALATVVADPNNHKQLLDAGVIQSLTDALLFTRTSSVNNRPLIVNLLRVLADLARSQLSHSQFQNDQFLSLLTDILRDAVQAATPPWTQWLTSFFSWTSANTNKNHQKQLINQSESVDTLDDSLVPELKPLDLTNTSSQMDLDEGIMYHAMRCASNLAKNSNMHTTLVKSGILTPLCLALSQSRIDQLALQDPTDEQNAEMIRCNIIAVSALAKSAPADVVSGGGHKKLIYFMEQSVDKVAQMYAAGGIRNLARHDAEEKKHGWRVHRELVVNGVGDALSKAMSEDAAPKTKSFAVLAFADLMSTGHQKAEIIKKRLANVYSSFSSLLAEKNPAVAAAVFRALTIICDQGQRNHSNEVVLPELLRKKLIEEIGQVVHGALARGDVAALKAICAMCRDKVLAHGLVDKGLIEMLVRGTKQGKGEYWEQSIVALSALSSWNDLVHLLVSRGALRTVTQRPCLEDDGRWAATFLANIARSDDYQVQVAHGGLKLLVMAASSRNQEAVEEGARGLYNLSLGGVSKVMVSQSTALQPLVKAARSTSQRARRFAVGALAEISESFEQAKRFVEADVLSVLLKAEENDPELAKFVAKCIGHLSQVPEVHGTLARSGAAAWCMDKVSKNGGRGPNSADVMHYATIAVCNISYSPGITRTSLRDSGAISVLTALTSSGMNAPFVLHSAKQALKNLKGNDKPSMVPIDPTGNAPLPA